MKLGPPLSILMVLAAAAAPASSPGLADGWLLLAHFKADEARQIFERASASGDVSTAREDKFGLGVSLLVQQPVLAALVAEASQIFHELAAGGADDPGLGARYFLGRIAEFHQESPDMEEAARQFRQLLLVGGDSAWAQTALTRLAILQIYAIDSERAPAARVAAAARLLAAAHDAAAESDLRLVLADAIFFYRLPIADALPHLLAAEKLGQLDGPTRADVLVQIAEVSSLLGRTAQARTFYEKLLAEFPRDQRHYMIRRKLADLDGGASRPRP